MKLNMKPIVVAITLQASIGIFSSVFAANNVQLPDTQPGNLQIVGRYSTVGMGIPSQNNNLNVELGDVANGKGYMSMYQNCIGDRWPLTGLPPQNADKAGTLVKGGALVLDVNSINNVFEAGRLPWSESNPIASENPITTTRPQYLRATSAGVPKVAKLGNVTLLAIEWSGDGCIPRFPNITPGLNGLELWDITNPDPAKAKYLSYIQFTDSNPINAVSEPRGVVPSFVSMFKKGDKNYLAVAVEGTNLGTMKFYDITDATQPKLVATWGPEQYQFGIDSAAVANATSATMPSLDTLNNYAKTIDPKSFGFSVRGNFPGNASGYVTINKKGTRAYVSAGNAGLFLLDISDLGNIKVISVARDLAEAARGAEVGSSYTALSDNEKTVVERASMGVAFFKFTINSDPNYYVAVAEAGFTPKIASTPPFNGTWPTTNSNLVYVGDACTNANGVDSVPPAQGDQYAIALRGTCSFLVKATNIQNKGYKGYIVFNSVGAGNIAITQAGIPSNPITIPSVGIPYYAGLKVLDPALIPSGYPEPTISQLTYAPGLPNLPVCRPGFSDPMNLCGKLAVNATVTTSGFLKGSGIRIWNYTNENNPVLESTLDTNCTNNPGNAECTIAGVGFAASEPKLLSNHDLYIPWGADGLFKVSLKKLAAPELVSNFKNLSSGFSDQNGGPASYPVVYPDRSTGCIYTSTNYGGLYIFEDPTDDKICGQ